MVDKKRLLLLGGSRYLIPVIECAHKLGCQVITMDYLPDNAAHRFSDEYINLSIVDKEAVLNRAKKLSIDGIMSFACDPGVITAAYVAERLNLPFQCSYDSALILQNKGRFRSFLRENGFNCPEMHLIQSVSEVDALSKAITYPSIAKPVDSAGSKGCTKVCSPEELKGAVETALCFSKEGICIIEEFIEKAFPSSDSDCFTVDGRFECVSFSAQLFDDDADNPYTPAAYCMPSGMPESERLSIKSDLQRLSDLLGLKTGVYNVESRVGKDGLPYIMEVSPRGGGNRLCEMLRYASGVDLIEAAVLAALGEEPQGVHDPNYEGIWYQEILHSKHGGTFKGIEYTDGFADLHVRDEQLWVELGTRVEGFNGANQAFGTVIMHFDSQKELDEFCQNKSSQMKIGIE